MHHAQSFLAQCNYFSINPLSILTREEKITAYKHQKLTQQKILDIESGKGGGMEEWEGDDEVMRKYCMLSLESNAQVCVDNIKVNQLELQLLASRIDMPLYNSKVEEVVDKQQKTQFTGPLLDKGGKAMRPFVITGREAIQNGVFKYGHTLPSMSIDDYLAQEMERGNFLSGGG